MAHSDYLYSVELWLEYAKENKCDFESKKRGILSMRTHIRQRRKWRKKPVNKPIVLPIPKVTRKPCKPWKMAEEDERLLNIYKEY